MALEVLAGPRIAALTVGIALGAIALIQSAVFRVWVTIVGALVTFQSQSGTLKLAYLAVAATCVLLALRDLMADSRGAQILSHFRSYLVASAVLGAYFVMSFAVAMGNGNEPLDWARDASPYLSAAALPVIGLQAGLVLPARTAMRIFVVAGLASTASFVLQWLTNRELLDVGRVAYGDNFLCAALFCLLLAYGAGGSRPLLAQAGAAVCLGVLLLTGNRTLVVLLVAFIGILGSPSRGRLSLGAVLRSLILFGLGITVVLQLSFRLIPGERELLSQRLIAAQTYLETGEDQSARSRAIQAGLAKAQFAEHPYFGTGPGHVYVDPYYIPNVSDPKKGHRDSLSLDTPLVVPAKLGLIGTTVLVAWMVALAATVRRWLNVARPTIIENALRGFGLVTLAFVPFGVTLEQKGFALTLMLFGCVLISSSLDDLGSRAPRQGTLK